MRKIALSLASLMLLFSCNKNQVSQDQQSLKSAVTALSKKYQAKAGNSADGQQASRGPSAGRAILADAVGAGTGAAFGPFAAALVACVYSAYDIEQQGYSIFSSEHINEGGNNPENPYDELGMLHNQVVYTYANENNGGVDYQVMNAHIAQKIQEQDPGYSYDEGTLNTNFLIGYTQVIQPEVYNEQGVNGVLNLAVSSGVYTPEEAELLSTYFNDLLNLGELSLAVNYSIDFENLVLNDGAIEDQSREKLLKTMVVARNSKALYYGTGIQ